MDNEARILLDDVAEFCRRDGREARLINMLEQSRAGDYTEDSLSICVPSKFAHAYLVKQRELIESYLEQITFAPMHLEILVDGAAGAALQAASGSVPTTTESAPKTLTGKTSLTPTQDAPSPSSQPGEEGVNAPARPTAGAGDSTRSGISVVNTVSPEQFRQLMAGMRAEVAGGSKVHSPGSNSAGAPAEPATQGPSVDINAKFTFESFVAGDENRHAFNSAMRFAAYAEEPGQCTSLFLYGNSGLGKTHLLFAISNYLAKEKPYVRVKYANSQAYLDDYMRELGGQHGPGGTIMREYRDADVLIIDDVQNIVGKQASVEFFFQLVDSFIRDGKKIAIASDRAPKKLGMDERLTSRFNAGMLCLVSEPGFEMKYLILKRYYENIIRGGNDIASMNVDTSLLSALQTSEGHLSDEHLRHMAEISGNNIRELESFCERCAGLSAEREAAHGELSAEDIDRVAEEYFDTAHKVIRVATVQKVVEEFYRVSHEDLIGPRRNATIAFARHVAVYLANNLCELTTPAIGAEFGGRDHSTVLNSLKVVENKMKEDRRICEDLQAMKNKIILKS